MQPGNIFASVPVNLDDEVVNLLLQSENVRIERIISKGHTSPESGWYNQERDEWVMVLQGGAVVSFEGAEDVALEAGDYVNIPAHRRHKVAWTHADMETIWLAVHYSRDG